MQQSPSGHRSEHADIHPAAHTRIQRRRSLWIRVHVWLGAGLGLFFVVLGLTGSLLVFDDEIDALLNPALLLVEHDGDNISPGEVLAVIDADADSGFRAAWLSAPRLERGAWQAFGGPHDDPFGRMVAIDPVTGEVLGSRSLRTGFITITYSLHTRLLLGLNGRNVVGGLGIAFALSLVTGACLWWPRRHLRSNRASGFTRAGPRLASIHRSLGIALLAPLLVVVISGIGLRLPALMNPVIERFSELEDHAGDARPAEDVAGAPLPVDRALDRAREHFPEARMTGIGMPRNEGDVYQFAFLEPEHPRRDIGRSYVWMDPVTGEILAMRRWSEIGAGNRFRDWLNPLHSGSAFGLPGRLLIVLLGLMPALLFITGLSTWLARRQRGRKRSVSAGTAQTFPRHMDVPADQQLQSEGS